MWDQERLGFGDEELLAAARGDKLGLDRICAALVPLVRTKVLAALCCTPGHFHAGEDLIQDVMAALLRGIPGLHTPILPVLRSYVHRTVHQRVNQYWRARYRQLPVTDDIRRARSLLDDASTRTCLGQVNGHDPTAGPYTRVDRAETFARVLLTLGTLSPPHREAVELAFFDQLETGEIGELLGITRNNAAMRLQRGLTELRQRLRAGEQTV